MITEDYISFEIAKLLKEKGFDWECISYYVDDEPNDVKYSFCGETNSIWESRCCSAPTFQMTMKWLREVHHIHTEICLYKTNEDDIEPKKSRKAPYYTFGVWDSVTGNNVDKRLTNDFIGDTYEEVCEAAIKYCLENLI